MTNAKIYEVNTWCHFAVNKLKHVAKQYKELRNIINIEHVYESMSDALYCY